MKKTLILLLIMLLGTINMVAQKTEHIKFMGIPLSGTPAAFGQKLAAKGFKYCAKLEDGSFVYAGKFSGEKSTIYICKGAKNTIPFVGVIINRETESEINSLFDSFEEKLDKKYSCVHWDGMGVNRELEYSTTGGNIKVLISKDNNYPYDYELTIIYTDTYNSKQTKDAEIDDL